MNLGRFEGLFEGFQGLLKVFVHRLRNDSLNAQAYNHINATIISIGTD